MSARSYMKRAVRRFDDVLARLSLPAATENGRLLSFVFHGLFESRAELEAGSIDPQQGITVEMLREVILHFQSKGYDFTTPEAMVAGLSNQKKYILLTFDDGYFNNVRALPVMEEFDVSAVFFISTDHVRYARAFWWDVIFRELRKRGRSETAIVNSISTLKCIKTEDIEFKLSREFGESALLPISDLDRPFTSSELRDFATHRLVRLGNHTKGHAILTNYSPAEVRQQIEGAQDAIREMTGKIPQIIAYPNGNTNCAISGTARDLGLQLGVIAHEGKNQLPLDIESPTAMNLKRFHLWGNSSIESQCRACRSDLSLFRLLKRVDFRTRRHSLVFDYRKRMF